MGVEEKIRALVDEQHQAFLRSAEERRDHKLNAFLAIIKCLRGGRKTVLEIGRATDIDFHRIYYYLRMLERSDIIDKEPYERKTIWSLKE